MSNLFSTNEVYQGSTTIGPMWICLQEQTFQKQINLYPPKLILINISMSIIENNENTGIDLYVIIMSSCKNN